MRAVASTIGSTSARGWWASARLEKERIVVTDVPRRLRADRLGTGQRPATQYRRHPDQLRGGGEGRHRAGLLQCLHRHPPGLPRSAHRRHRDRAEHDLRGHAHRGAAQAVPIPGRGAAEPAGRAQGEERAAGAADRHAPRLRGAAQAAAGSAPGDQPGAGREGPDAREPEGRGRNEEPPDRARPQGAAGEGGATGADVQIQVRVPRQHVARAADPAEQPPDPEQAARRQCRPEPDPQAARVRPDHPRLGRRTCCR